MEKCPFRVFNFQKMSFKRKLSQDNTTRKICKNSKILYIQKQSENNNCDKLLDFESNCDFLQDVNLENYKNKLEDCDTRCESEENIQFCSKMKSDECVKKQNENCAGVRNKQKKEPLPMKLRAFPQSFWQQPNKTPSVSPGTVYCIPPLLSKEDNSPENRENLEEVQLQKQQEIVSEPNIDLLFSLFRSVEEEQRKALGQERSLIIRRGRPKKLKTESKVIRDDDPYLTSSAAESLLPLLPVRNNFESLQSKIAKDEQILAMVSIDGSSPTLLTSVTNSANQNYSQILSELVVQL